MATKNYVLEWKRTLENKSRSSLYDIERAYREFDKVYTENLLQKIVESGYHHNMSFFDIQGTSVTTADYTRLKIYSTQEEPNECGNNHDNFANLRITGIEENIQKVEDEIRSHGFALKEMKQKKGGVK